MSWRVELNGTFDVSSIDGCADVSPFEANSAAGSLLAFALAQETPPPSAQAPVQCTLHRATYVYEETILKTALLEEAATVDGAPGEEAWPDYLLDMHRHSICHSLQLEAEELAGNGPGVVRTLNPAEAPTEWYDERFPMPCRNARSYDADLDSGEEDHEDD